MKRLVLGVVLSGLGCGGSPGPLASISIAPTTSSILVGGTQQFSAAARDSSGRPISGVELIWTTSSVSLAQADSTGLVTGLKLGAVSVTASASGISSAPASLIIETKPGVPSSPTGLTTGLALAAVRLTWNPNTNADVTSYSVYRASSPWTTWSPDLPAAATQAGVACCTHVFSGLEVGTEYSFAVSATNPIGEGVQSTQVRARPSAVSVDWTTKTSMPTARFDFGAAVVGGKIYAIGGDSGSLLRTVEIYDPAADTWTTATPMPTARARLAVAAVNGKIYAIGGQSNLDPNSRLSTATEEYDPATNQWLTRTPMPTTSYITCGNTAGAAINGKIYAWPGSCQFPPPPTLFVYDPATDAWTTGAAVPFQNLLIHTMTTMGGRIWALEPGSSAAALVAQYDDTLDTWSVKPPVHDLQQVGNAPLFGVLAGTAQTLYAFGYQDRSGSGQFTAEARYFDSAAGTWPETNPLAVARSRFATVTIGNEIFAIGGAIPVSPFGGVAVPMATVEAGLESR